MKKLLVILFALGLVFSFTAPVMATDVSFDGTYRVRGFYDSNSALTKDAAAHATTPKAYYDQRFRLNTVFQVAEGLKVVVRFDALEGTWGTSALRNPSVAAGNTTSRDAILGTTPASSQSQANLQFDKAYVSFVTGIGLFEAGYNSWGVWGTGFGDEESFVGQIGYKVPVGDNLVFLLKTAKVVEGDTNTSYADYDDDKYVAAAVYFNDTVQAGFLYTYYRYENFAHTNVASYLLSTPPGTYFDTVNMSAVNPYVKLTLGDLYIESELLWVDGKAKNTTGSDVDLEGLTFYLMGKYNLGPIYLGALFAYVQGDDPTTNNNVKLENALSLANSGADWDPCLILFSDTCTTSLGQNGAASIYDTSNTCMTGTSMTNGFLYQVFAGAAFDKLSMKASLTFAEAHEDTYYTANTPASKYLSKDYGTEFDITASYKLYDNLTYTVGAGYLWAGDYYKGSSEANEIDDTYLLMNKLQVTF